MISLTDPQSTHYLLFTFIEIMDSTNFVQVSVFTCVPQPSVPCENPSVHILQSSYLKNRRQTKNPHRHHQILLLLH